MKINPYKKAEEVRAEEKQAAPSALQRFLERRLKKTEDIGQKAVNDAAGQEIFASQEREISAEAESEAPAKAAVSAEADTPDAALSSEQELRELARDATLDAWHEQEQALRAKNPDFDLLEQTENPVFMALLEDGLSVFDAFEVSHMASDRRNRENVPEPTLQRVRENGITAQSGITLRPDVSRLTPKERANIALRAAKGEKIVL